MYILIVARGYPSNKYKIHGNFEFDQAKALKKAGCKVVYAAIDIRSIRKWRKWGFEHKFIDNIEVYAINIPLGPIPKILLEKFSIIAFSYLYNKIKKISGIPDIVHAHFLGSGYVASKVLKKSSTPLIITEHFSLMNQESINQRLIKKAKFTYSKAKKVIAVSNHLADNIKNKIGIEPVVIPNLIDLSNFKYIQKNKSTKIYIFISVGHLTQNKNMDKLIEAFSENFIDNSKVILYIFGDGPERPKLEKIIRTKKMENQIFLMGVKNRIDIAHKMSESNCFVLVSKRETFGVAYIEAMAMGLPVIASRCGGPEDFIDDSNGMILPKNDTTNLKRALLHMFKNSDLYDSKHISKTTKNKFNPDSISNRIINIYKTLK